MDTHQVFDVQHRREEDDYKKKINFSLWIFITSSVIEILDLIFWEFCNELHTGLSEEEMLFICYYPIVYSCYIRINTLIKFTRHNNKHWILSEEKV